MKKLRVFLLVPAFILLVGCHTSNRRVSQTAAVNSPALSYTTAARSSALYYRFDENFTNYFGEAGVVAILRELQKREAQPYLQPAP